MLFSGGSTQKWVRLGGDGAHLKSQHSGGRGRWISVSSRPAWSTKASFRTGLANSKATEKPCLEPPSSEKEKKRKEKKRKEKKRKEYNSRNKHDTQQKGNRGGLRVGVGLLIGSENLAKAPFC